MNNPLDGMTVNPWSEGSTLRVNPWHDGSPRPRTTRPSATAVQNAIEAAKVAVTALRYLRKEIAEHGTEAQLQLVQALSATERHLTSLADQLEGRQP